MEGDTQEKERMMRVLAREIAENLTRMGGASGSSSAMLPGDVAYPACGMGMPASGCERLDYAPITTYRFYRSGRTNIDQVVEGKIPVAPGTFVVLSQAAHPPWATGCFSLRFRLANNGTNFDEVKIEWFVDGEPLDREQYGTEIYNVDGTVIGTGLLPIPLAMGEHCCIGGSNRLRVKISHLGAANQIESIRLFVEHARKVACCSACASGRTCQQGCKNEGH